MKYAVTIEAVVQKTYFVDAESFAEAEEQAHGIFAATSEDGVPDNRYEQETISIEEDEQ